MKRVEVCKSYYLATSNCKTKAQNALSDFQDETSFDSLVRWVTKHTNGILTREKKSFWCVDAPPFHHCVYIRDLTTSDIQYFCLVTRN